MASKAQMPRGWRLVRLGDVAEINPRRPPLSVPAETPVTFLPMAAIAESSQGIVARESRPYSEVSTGYTYFEENDFLFSKITPCLQNGKHTLATGLRGGFGFGTTEFHVVRTSSILTAPFMFRALTQAHIIDRCSKSFTGTAGQQRVQPETLKDLPILLPPLPEQRAIAAVLDSIDDAIERTDAVITATEQLRDSLLHELLTRGVPGWHTEWKDLPGLGTIPADWEVVRLEEVAKVERGKFAHRPRNEPRFYGGDVPFIQTGDVVRADGRIKEHSQTLNQLGMSISRLFPAGTIVLTIAANIGETAIAEYPVAFPDSLVGVIPRRINTNFLEYFLRTQKSRLNHFAPESAQKNINLDDLRPLLTPLPSSQEQHSIASCIDEVAETLAQVQQERERLSAMKDSTADALLTGRVRVI